MKKRFLALLMAVVTLVMVVVPATVSVSAEYENTHTNTGDQRYDIVQVALTQVGYEEGDSNYTKYGEYHGNPNAEWCGYFVSWCARQAGIPTSVLRKTGVAYPSSWGLSTFKSSDRLPQAGDLFFKNGGGHVGIVYSVDAANDIVYTIEGNTSTSGWEGHWVMKRSRTLSQHTYASPNYSGSEYSGHTHSYSDHFEDAHPHKIYKQCDSCGYVTYTGDEKTLDSCTTCIQENCSHSYSAWESTGDSEHKRACPTCGKTETGDHDWEDVKVTKEANCKEAGSKIQECSVCGVERTRTIEKTEDHDYGDWEYVNDETHKRTCEFCGGVGTEEHDIDEQTEWQTDEKEHWYECSVCEEKVKLGEHEYGGDCVAPCEVCEYVREDGHFYEENWSFDGEKHWYNCENCDAQGNVEEHVYSAECDEDCDICGYVREVTHSYPSEMDADGTGHWYECDVCGKKDGFTQHTPGPDATEDAAQLCTVCSYELAAKIPHVHKYEPFQTNTMTHWGKCVCGHELAPEAHMWDVSTGKCATCGKASIVETDNTNWDFVWFIAGAVVVAAVVVSAGVMVHGRKKRKELEADPYWA